MMVDLGAFSDEKFDAKKWINAACQSRHPQDPVEKHLADLEMKLQMLSEEIAASLEEQSSAALLRVPRAGRDVIRLRDDAVSLRNSVSGILLKLKKAEGSSAESIAALAKVDTVKQRMEAAYETLQDAAGLTQLSASVEDVFASGDLPRAAETLANMRHCLSAVGEVAEFANVRKQLEVLEDRLEGMVQPRLYDALSNRKVDAVQDLRKILIRIGRFKSLELHYTKVHLKPIKQLWEEFDSRQRANKLATEKHDGERLPSISDSSSSSLTLSFSSWLPSFYDEVLLYIEQEWKWCKIGFPDDYRTLVPKLLIETMTKISASFASRINLATGDVVRETRTLAKGILDILSGDIPKGTKIQTRHLEALIELHSMTGAFARNIQHLFSESDLQVLLDTLKAVYSPYETYKKRYGQMDVYDVLISKVRQRLSDVSRLPIWSSVEEPSAFPLPSFSVYPQSYVTSVGEYLLTLPQQLEPLAEGISSSDANTDEAQFFATDWMFKVAEGATALYMEQLRGIQYITDRGAQQLSADIDYLSNVLSALSMPIPQFLYTYHTCLSTPRDQLRDVLKSDAVNQLDLPTAHLVCKIRRVPLDQ